MHRLEKTRSFLFNSSASTFAASALASATEGGATTRAYGKLILFGEHFVVYKVPAIVAAVSAYTDCELSWTAEPGLSVIDDRPAVPQYKEKKRAEGEVGEIVSLIQFLSITD